MLLAYSKIIRNIIKENHSHGYYKPEEVYPNIEQIADKFNKESKQPAVKFEDIQNFVNDYIHYIKKTNLYRFNLQKKNTIKHNFIKPTINTIVKNDKKILKTDSIESELFEKADTIIEKKSKTLKKELLTSENLDSLNSITTTSVQKPKTKAKSKPKVKKANKSTTKKPSNNSVTFTDLTHTLETAETVEIVETVETVETIYSKNKLLSPEQSSYMNDETQTSKLKKTNSSTSDNRAEYDVEKFGYDNVIFETETHKTSSYSYPVEDIYEPIKVIYDGFNKDWVHAKQKDDKLTSVEIKRKNQCDFLKKAVQPDQRTAEWYEMRKKRLTASDLGTVLDMNKYEAPFKFILKKTVGIPFEPSEACYHGKKFEQTATLIYEYRMNCKIQEYGLIMHPKYAWLGASPDGIIDELKFDGIHKSNQVGKMLEIKCPFRRDIKMSGEIYDWICPKYYWAQVQLQLEVCELDECDFLQCKIEEYESREQFLEDTDINEPFKSQETGFEKGCLIQLLPINKASTIGTGDYNNAIYDHATFLHPPRVNMTPHELDIWLNETISNKEKYKGCVIDRIVYWKLEKCKNVTIVRDKEWFESKFPIMQNMWNLVNFFQENKTELNLLLDFINNSTRKINKTIMNIAERLANTESETYQEDVKKITNDIEKLKKLSCVD